MPFDAANPHLMVDLDRPASDVKLLNRALKNRWPMSDALRANVVESLATVLKVAGDDPRAVVGAARALIEADRLNMEQENLDGASGDSGSINVTVKDRKSVV